MSLPTCNISHYPVFYRPNIGNLGRVYNTWRNLETLSWYNCRESFHAVVDQNSQSYKYYFLCHNPEAVAGLVNTVENILGVERCGFAVHRNYQGANALEVRPPRFWTMIPMRHSFFTCVLRAGLNYDHIKNPLQTLQDSRYFGDSWPAVEKFLRGHTWYSNSEQVFGWYNVFSKYTRDNAWNITGEKGVNLDTLRYPNDDDVKGRSFYVWEEWGKPNGREGDIWYQSQKDCGTVRI